MGLRINQNIEAFNAYRNLSQTQSSQTKALEKLSSGFRINRAADDAAGLAISETLRAQVGGSKQAVRNAQDGISVVQTAEGALTEVHSMLQRMRELAVQALNTGANGGLTTASGSASAAIQSEIDSLAQAIDDISSRTKFNGTFLLSGSVTLDFQIGANGGERTSITTTGMGLTDLGLGSIGQLTTSATVAASVLATIDAAISSVSDYRGTLGAYQNRFEHTVNSLNVAIENLSASESRIRDTDMAQEMVEFTRANILSQAGTAMLAQANQSPQSILQLLK